MKVRELIERLQNEDPEATVGFLHPSHDYWKTAVVSGCSGVREQPVRWSDYHSKNIINDEYEEYGDVMVVIE